MSRRKLLRLLSISISIGLLIVIYSLIDTQQLHSVWRTFNFGWFTLAMLAVCPLLTLTVWRLQRLSPQPVRFWLGIRVNLQASTMNLIMPAKLGDIGKGAFLAQHTNSSSHTWLVLCTFEKIMDLAALLILCTFGLLIYPDLPPLLHLFILPVGSGAIALLIGLYWPHPTLWVLQKMNGCLPQKWQNPGLKTIEAWAELHQLLTARPHIRWQTLTLSLLLWIGHLGQIWLLAKSVGMDLSPLTTTALVPLGILAGLLPFTLGGLGTRDAAFMALLGSFATPAAAATLGLLTGLRYILPAALGLPLLGKDIAHWRAR